MNESSLTSSRHHKASGVRPRARNEWLIAAGLVLVAGVAALALSFDSGGNDVQVAADAKLDGADDTSTEETIDPDTLARSFIEASTPVDAAAAIASLAPEAEVSLGGFGSQSDGEAWFAWNRAIEWETVVTGCTTLSLGDLRCDYTYHNPWLAALEQPPIAGSTMTFTIVDGSITAVSEMIAFGPFRPIWDGFQAWLERVHPSSVALMLTNDRQPVLTEESLEAWSTHSAEFVDVVRLGTMGEAFMDALLSFDIEQLNAAVGTARDLHEERYLQGWSAATNYEVIARHPCEVTANEVVCVAEGRDDWGDAIGLTFLDRFTITVDSDGIASTVVWHQETTQPEVFSEFDDWIRSEDPALFEAGGACGGFFEGGSTPGACARAWVTHTDAFNAARTN